MNRVEDLKDVADKAVKVKVRKRVKADDSKISGVLRCDPRVPIAHSADTLTDIKESNLLMINPKDRRI